MAIKRLATLTQSEVSSRLRQIGIRNNINNVHSFLHYRQLFPRPKLSYAFIQCHFYPPLRIRHKCFWQLVNENALAEDFNCVFEMNIVIGGYK